MMVLKVVRLFEARQFRTAFGVMNTRKMDTKDQDGDKVRVTIFRNHFNYDEIEQDSVYLISKLKTDKYPIVSVIGNQTKMQLNL